MSARAASTPRGNGGVPAGGVRISGMERGPDGHFTARVSWGATTVDVHERYGSWMADNPLRDVLPMVAVLLVRKQRKLERSERRAAA